MPVTLTPQDAWRIHDPMRIAADMALILVSNTFHKSRREEKAAFGPIGRKNLIFVTDVVRGWHFTFKLQFMARADCDAFMALANTQRTLYLESIWTNDAWYIQFNEVVEQETAAFDANYITVACEADEQDAPS